MCVHVLHITLNGVCCRWLFWLPISCNSAFKVIVQIHNMMKSHGDIRIEEIFIWAAIPVNIHG